MNEKKSKWKRVDFWVQAQLLRDFDRLIAKQNTKYSETRNRSQLLRELMQEWVDGFYYEEQ